MYVHIDMFVSVYVCVGKWAVEYLQFWMIFMQMASSEWFVGVQLHTFENPYNVNIIDGNYCCCDATKCNQNISSLKGICITSVCQPYFLIHIKDSSCNGACYLDNAYHLSCECRASISDDAVFSIPFKDMELSDNVSTESVN